jgi:hypothetical protein
MIIDSDEGHVLTHLGLGDQITCNGLIRELYKRHSKLYVYCKIKYYYTIEFMYRDLQNLKVLPLEENGAQLFTSYHNIKNFYKLSIGSDTTVERSFYKQAGVDFNKKYESFYVQRDLERENIFYNKFNFGLNGHVFIHDDAERNQNVDNNKIIDKNLSIFRVNPSYTNNIFDYCKVIENANEIHTIESSFMFMIDLMFKDKNKNLFQHRCAKPIAPFEYPTNQSNWHIYE